MVLIIFPNTMSQSLAMEPPTGRKNMRAPRQVRVTCTMILKDGKPVCRGAGAPHLPRSNCVSWACIARNPPPERSNPLNGENLIYQVRELRRNLLRSCAVPVGSRNFVPRPLAVEPPTGGKNMRAPRPHTPRQVRITCTSANRVCRLLRSEIWCRCAASAAIQRRKLGVRSTKSPRRSGPIRSVART